LTPEQIESLRQAIFEGQIVWAINLYRRTVPDVSLAEAQDYVGTLAAELNAKHPEKFAAPKPRALNWRLMLFCLLVEVGVFTAFWGMMRPATPSAKLVSFSVGFLFGAGTPLSTRLNPVWKQFLAWILCLFMAWVVLVPLAPRFSSPDFFAGGLLFGVGMALSGLTRKRRKSTQNKQPLTDGSPAP
jgi:hypothetical protein